MNPYKHFPDRPYFQPILDVLNNEPVTFIEKSRTMMMTWLVMGWAAHMAFTRPARKIVFQSEDEDRAVHGIECCKELWRNSYPELQKRWPLVKDVDKQAFTSLELKNGSQIVGIPGNPDKVRSEHPSVIVFDEACHMSEFGESYGVAIATRTPKMVALSSADVGAFRDATRAAKVVEWPNYSEATAA